MDDLYVPNQTLLVVTAIGIAAWFGLVLAVLLVRVPKPVRPAPETTDLGSEPPAVANLLANGFELTRDAVPATLVDLAARGFVEIEDRGIGNYVCRVDADARGESGAEQMMVAHLLERAADGVVPAEALTTGPQDRSKAWWGEFRKRVVADAQERGLSRNLWDSATTVYLFLAAVPIALTFGVAIGFRDLDDVQGSALLDGLVFAGAAIVIALFAMTSSKWQRSTDAGRAAAARWLGVREALEGAPSFPELPPSGVTVWERHLAYATALGVAPRTARSLPMGAESDTEAWTASSGEWRKVRVRYPRLRPGWGRHPGLAVAIGVWGTYVGFNMVLLAANEMGFEGWNALPGTVATSLALTIGSRSALQLLAGLADLFVTKEVEGVVIRARTRWSPWPYFNQKDEQNARYFVAIDDGRSDVIAAYRVGRTNHERLTQGTKVKLKVTPLLGYVSIAD